MDTNYSPSKVVYIMIGLASFVIFVAGIKAAGEIVVPLLMALFFTLNIFPILVWSKKHSIPLWISITLITLVIIAVFSFFVLVLGFNIKSLSGNIPDYHDLLEQRWESVSTYLQERGIDASLLKISDLVSSSIIKETALESLGLLTLLIEDSFLVLILMIFMLFASSTFPVKIAAIASNKKSTLQVMEKIIHMISQYMVIKTVISMATGILVSLLLLALDMDHPVFWGFMAFALNYIPNIGSFLAAIPVVFLALIQYGFEQALYITIGYVIINIIMGNVVEPKLMGKSTELSVVFIFLSMLFWGWVLGPVGMFLSVPLSIVMKIVFENFESTRWLSIIMGPEETLADKKNGGRKMGILPENKNI